MEGLCGEQAFFVLDNSTRRVPMVATDVPGLKDMIQHMKTGYLIDSQEPGDLAYAIEYVLRDKQDAGNMVKHDYAFAEMNFSKEVVLQKIRDELRLLLSK